MKKLTKFIALTLIAAMLLSFAGCGGSTKYVAKVNGENYITYDEYYDALNGYCQSYYISADDLDKTLGVESANDFRNLVVDELIKMELAVDHAPDYDAELTEEELEQMQKSTDKFFEDVLNTYISEVDTDYTEDGVEATEEEIKKEAEKRAQKYYDEHGYTEEYVLNYYKEYTLYTKVCAAVSKEAKVSEDEVSKYYDDLLAAQKAYDDETLLLYYTGGYNEVNVVAPKGVRMIKHVLISIPEEYTEKIKAAADETEAAKLKKEALASIKEKAEEVLKLAKGGEDFDKLITEYSGDASASAYYPDGYTVYKDSGFVDEFETAALKLRKVGDISGLVASDFGYHILLYSSEVKPGVIPLEDVHDDIYNILLESAQSNLWYDTLDKWLKEANVEYLTENYHSTEEKTDDASEDTTEVEESAEK